MLTEYDVENSEASVRQPDTMMFRTWEVAGSSHVDQHLRMSREPLELAVVEVLKSRSSRKSAARSWQGNKPGNGEGAARRSAAAHTVPNYRL
jgi:hypothetical protein